MAKIIVTQAFDYRWPSGCITAYPYGYAGTVKQEVLDFAIAKGLGKDGVPAPRGKRVEIQDDNDA